MFGELLLYLPGILLAYGVFLIGIASPGPNILAVIGTSMSEGRASGLALAWGVAAGSLTWGILSAAGLTVLLSHYATALTAIKIIGGAFLLWLAFKSFKAARSDHIIETSPMADNGRGPWGFGLRGYIVQMTNPKAALAWVATISLGLQPGAPIWVAIVIVAGTAILSFVCHSLYALAFSTPVMVRFYSKARRGIQTVLGVFFTFAGLRLMLSRV